MFKSCAILKHMNQNIVLRFQHKLHLVQEIFLRNEDRHVEFSVVTLESHEDNPSLLKKTLRMLYAFFWVIPRRLNFICRRFGTLCLFHLHRQVGRCLPAYEDGTDRVFQNVGI